MSFLGRIFRSKLQTKLTVPVSILVTASVLTIAGYLIHRQADSFRHEVESNGETIVRLLAIQAETGVIFESRSELDELLSQLRDFEGVQYAEIKNGDELVISTFGNWDDALVATRVPLRRKDDDPDCRFDSYLTDHAGREFMELRYPVFSRTEIVSRENLGMTSNLNGTIISNYVTEEIGSLRLILNMDKLREAVNDARTAAIFLTLIVLALTIVGLNIFVRALIKPIKLLVDVTDQVSRGDLEQQVPVNQADEIGHLAQTFNRMIESLRQSRDEIEEYNRDLEKKIIDRTLALEEAQSQLIQSEKMSAIGQLAAGVAHELNNPLGGILGYAQFALEKMKKLQNSQQEVPGIESFVRYLSDIESQSRRCKNIVQNLLRFSRSTRSSEFDEIDVNKVIEDTTTFVEHQLHMKQISLEVDLDDTLPTIGGNAGQLQQVFTNMIINAMHASSPESKIKIITRHSPPLGEFGGAIETSFTDEGSGIAPENLTKIFEPFFTTKDIGEGTGLGLSVSYGIIKDHGGEIRVESELNRGTTFTIILPLQKPSGPSDNQNKEFLAEPKQETE